MVNKQPHSGGEFEPLQSLSRSEEQSVTSYRSNGLGIPPKKRNEQQNIKAGVVFILTKNEIILYFSYLLPSLELSPSLSPLEKTQNIKNVLIYRKKNKKF